MSQDKRRVSTIRRMSERTKALAEAMEAKAREQLGLLAGQSFEEQFDVAEPEPEPEEPTDVTPAG